MENTSSDLFKALGDKVYLPDSQEYAESLNTYFSAQENQIKPACIVRPQTAADVATTISLLGQINKSNGFGSLNFAIRSGGHACFAGSANAADGVTIDLRDLNYIEVDEGSSQVIVGTGASWGHVYRTLDPLGLAIPGGRHSQVGVGGLTLGGGLSHFSARVGFVCDNVLKYEVVLPSGDIIRTIEDDTEHGDLFRALRGGSNNFGVITRFVFRAFRQGRLWGGTLIQPLESKDSQLQAFYDFCVNPSYDSNASLIQSVGMSAERGAGFVNSIVYTKPESEPAVIKPFMSIEPVYLNTLRELSLTELTKEQDAFNENGLCQVMVSTTYYTHLPLLQRTYDLWQASCDSVRDYDGIVWSMSFHPIVPAIVSRSPLLQSVLPSFSSNQKPIVIAQLTGTWKNPKDTPIIEAAAVQLIADIDSAAQQDVMQTGYIYLNYAHAGQRVFGEGERREWLRGVSKRYDPDGIFQHCVSGGFKLFGVMG